VGLHDSYNFPAFTAQSIQLGQVPKIKFQLRVFVALHAFPFQILRQLLPRVLDVRLSTMSYRSKMARVLWPEIFIATFSGIPARTMFRTAERRRS
jgi:hypothetical protein